MHTDHDPRFVSPQSVDVPEWEWSRHPIMRRAVVEAVGSLSWQLGPCAPHVMDQCVAAVARIELRRSSAGTLVARLGEPINEDWFVDADAGDEDGARRVGRTQDITRWYARHRSDGAEMGFVCAETIEGVRRYFEWIEGIWVRVPTSRWVTIRDDSVAEALTDDEAREASPAAVLAPRILRCRTERMPREHAQLQIQLARAIARSAHAAQVDKLGEPYIEHPARVAARFDPETQAVEHAAAWLHDVVEDTATTTADLLEAGIDPEIVEVVVLLTRDAATPPREYHERIRGNAKAFAVKASDIDDNTAPWRAGRLDPAVQEWLAKKYADARAALDLEPASTASLNPILYIEMDTLVDFRSAFPLVDPRLLEAYQNDVDDIPGIFAHVHPLEGAIDAVSTLAEHFDVYVLSTAPWNNPSAWSDKLTWIQRHFGAGPESMLYKRLILSHHKDLNRGAILIDDRPGRNGAAGFEGTVIPFGTAGFADWRAVVEKLRGTDAETLREAVADAVPA
ncbi:HD domain-containing protein [Microbacterium sp. NPDC019599]|uniref:5' nucleotidase, NT5C type n=1 Tax=Microbacterium sp. NPDC019599 TaxID=3154690 RepID=UPI00340F0839